MATKVLGLFFWIWGIAGLLLNSINYLSLSGSVGVGTSTYVALGFLYWIAGMVLFGVLMARAAPVRLSEPIIHAPLPPSPTEAPLPLQSIAMPPPAAAATDERTQPRFGLPLKLAAAALGIGAVIFVAASSRTISPGGKVAREQVTRQLVMQKHRLLPGQLKMQTHN